MSEQNQSLLEKCLLLIEQQLGWGKSDDWLNQDFEQLSERILEATQTKLSVTTLKRVWGKVNYASDPSVSTLNALAQFVGFSDWSDFRKGHSETARPRPPRTPRKASFINRKTIWATGVLLLLLVAFMLNAFLGNKRKNTTQFDTSSVTFSSNRTGVGLPNSVIFNYDLSSLNVDSAFIQQSWNEALTFQIDPERNTASGIYYYPGYFRAKLIANDQIVKEHDVYIKTDGWRAIIQEKNVPRYLYQEEFSQEEILRVTSDVEAEIYAKDLDTAEVLSFHYFEEFQEVDGLAFEFSTRFRNNYRKSNGICQHSSVLVHGTEGVLLLPFSIPGCVSDLTVFYNGNAFSGKTNDFSSFGYAMDSWQNLRIVSERKTITVFRDKDVILELPFEESLGKIVGFRFRFQGMGEVDYVRLTNLEKVIFEDDFQPAVRTIAVQ